MKAMILCAGFGKRLKPLTLTCPKPLLKIGKGSSGLIILESMNSNSYIWVSKDNVYIETKHGRIVQTEGLFNNLTNLTLPDKIFEEVLFGLIYRLPQDLQKK